MKALNNDIYYKPITYENVISTWDIVRRTCKNKRAIFRYHVNKNSMNYNIYQILLNGLYKPLPFRLFLIFEPKARLVMSQTVGDKIVNHFVAKYYLLPYLEDKLIDSNVATRKGKGSKYADKLINDYINKIRINNPESEIYVLKIDISKYFYTIPHDILMEKLAKRIQDINVLKIIKTIIDETDKPYINNIIDNLNKKYGTNIPHYEKGVGLSIGAMTSQFLAIFFLNDLDHYIKEDLGCKYYVRYMDDFIIIDTDRDRLKKAWKLIEIELTKLKLKINPKSSIVNLKTGITFLGYKYKIDNDKYDVTYRKKTIKKIKKKFVTLKKHDLMKYYRSYGSYYGYLKKIKTWEREFTMKAIEKYDYFKEKNPKKIILVKEGSFYKTYKDDAKLLWNLFGYKWNNSSIAFGVSNAGKIFDKIKSQGLGYITIENDSSTIEIQGNDTIYDSYLNISLINYEKYEKKNRLHKMLDELIDQDMNFVNTLEEYFNTLQRGDGKSEEN